MRLKYKAQKADGTFYEETREASDKFALSRELHAEGETLLSAIPVDSSKTRSLQDLLAFIPVIGRVSMRNKIIFTRNLAGMLSAGLTVSRALGVLLRQTGSPKFKEIISGLIGSISTGESLSQAFRGFSGTFPPIMISMIQAGEEGGNLSTSLLSVSEQMDRTYTLQRKIRGALMYPAVVVTVMIGVGIVLFVKVVPQMTASFRDFNVELPLSTRTIIAVSDFMQSHFMLGLLLAFAVLLALVAVARSPAGKRAIDFILLRVPVIAPIIREANAARVGQTLSSLLSSGVEVIQALGITAEVLSNHLFKDVLLQARTAIEKGEPMSGIFRQHETVFPPFLSEMIAVGEETGKLSPMLKETGLFFEGEVEQKTKNISVIIEPVLMVIVGIVVGFFAVAMISPAYSLMNAM